MNSAWYALAMVAVALVIKWLIVNDGREETTGFLAMKNDRTPRKLRREKRARFNLNDVR